MDLKNIKSVKGMPDLLPNKLTKRTSEDKIKQADKLPDIYAWQFLEKKLKKIAEVYGYEEIRTPVLEQIELFKRSIGNETDIVSKEMFVIDRGEQTFAMRPEGTASCVRACLEHGLIRNSQVQQLWYLSPMFRAEEPQLGRYRQFHQFGIEAFNLTGPDIDAMQIAMLARLFKELNLIDKIRLEINSLGDLNDRKQYKVKLIEYFEQNYDLLDSESKIRLKTNPLRILDSKNPKLKELINNAPKLIENLGLDAKQHFEGLKNILTELNIKFSVNSKIVRGLDYYNRTVYEWVTDDLGAQSAVAAGGRYDALVEQLGGQSTPAVGFALGLERVLLLMGEINKPKVDVYFICLNNIAKITAIKISEEIKNKLDLNLHVHLSGGNLKKQLKKASSADASLAFILGEEELEKSYITVKYLKEDKPQINLLFAEVIKFLGEYCG